MPSVASHRARRDFQATVPVYSYDERAVDRDAPREAGRTAEAATEARKEAEGAVRGVCICMGVCEVELVGAHLEVLASVRPRCADV